MKSYIVKQKDLNSRMLSRSGGIFAAISDQVLAQGGGFTAQEWTKILMLYTNVL